MLVTLAAIVILLVFWPVTAAVIGIIAGLFVLKWMAIAAVVIVGGVIWIAAAAVNIGFTALLSSPQALAIMMLSSPLILVMFYVYKVWGSEIMTWIQARWNH